MSSSSVTSNTIPSIDNTAAWHQLKQLGLLWQKRRLIDLFDADPKRETHFSFNDTASPSDSNSFQLDISKQRLDQDVLDTLLALAEQKQLHTGIQRLFSGANVNFTEHRAASHIVARSNTNAAGTEDTLQKMEAFTQQFHAGQIIGASGLPLKNIINIGIGGSDLGPRLLTEALMAGQRPLVPIRFVANIDPEDLNEALLDFNPAETLFIISSKSFTTTETLSNSERARAWLSQALGKQYSAEMLARHFAGVSNNLNAAQAFGILPERLFYLPQSVGGRFSVWSAVGLPAMLAIGCQRFREFLHGGQAMDTHFATTPFAHNLPVLNALVTLWNSQFLHIESLAVLPYVHALRSLPSYLQQLEMESNGKSTQHNGQRVAWHTSQILWGMTGTNGQHAFHQLFYQGTRHCSIDFIVANDASTKNNDADRAAQQALLINAQAQAQALMQGQSVEKSQALLQTQNMSASDIAWQAPHRSASGNVSSSTLVFPALTPTTLGKLIAFYEHKTFVLGWLWGINSFDQFGVELGKEMARTLTHSINNK